MIEERAGDGCETAHCGVGAGGVAVALVAVAGLILLLVLWLMLLMLAVLALFAVFLALLGVVLGQGAEDGAAERPQYAVADFVSAESAGRAACHGAQEAAVGFGALSSSLVGAVVVGCIGARGILVTVVSRIASGVRVVGLRVVVGLGLVRGGVGEAFARVCALVVGLVLVVIVVSLGEGEVLIVGARHCYCGSVGCGWID